MDGILRFNGASRRDPAVDAWLNGRPAEQRPLVQRWFERLRRCGPDVRELMHDGAATVCVGDAAFAYVAAFRAHVNVGFFLGARLVDDDPAGLLQGTGVRMRHVALRPDQAVDAAALERLIDAAYNDMQLRIGN